MLQSQKVRPSLYLAVLKRFIRAASRSLMSAKLVIFFKSASTLSFDMFEKLVWSLAYTKLSQNIRGGFQWVFLIE